MGADETHRGAGALLILLLMGSLAVMGGALVAPGLPSLVEPFQITDDAVGMVIGVFTLSAALTLPFTGLLLDMLGRRRVGIFCLLLNGTAGVLCAFAPSYGILLTLRFIQGAASAALIPTALVIISDRYPGKERLRLIGFFSGTLAASAAVSPLIGGILATRSWRYPFYAYGLSFALAVAFWLVIWDTAFAGQKTGARATLLKDLMIRLQAALKVSGIRTVFAHAVALYFLLFTVVTFLPLHLVRTHGLTEASAGLALSTQGLLEALVATQAGRVSRWLPGRPRLSLGFALAALSLMLLPLWSTERTLVVSLVFFGIGMGIVQPAIYHRATSASPRHLTGSVLGLFNTMKSAGMSLAPVLFMGIHARYGVECVFFLAAGLGLLWLVIFNILDEAKSDG